MPQNFKSTDVLRLEVEVPPTGLYNMISNPDGALGAWGWITPIAGGVLSTENIGGSTYGPSNLYYTAKSASPSGHYFYSEPMPITAGQYAAASFKADWNSTLSFRARLDFLNSSMVELTPSAWSNFSGGSFSQRQVPPALAPSGTVFVRLRIELASNTTQTYPSNFSGGSFRFNEVKVAKAATSGALGSTRKNLVTNPSFEVNTTGWLGAFDGTSIARTTTQAASGTASLAVTAASGNPSTRATTQVSVTPGRDYTLQTKSRAATTARQAILGVDWYDASGNMIYGIASGINGVNNTTSGWTLHRWTTTAPAGASYGIFAVGVRFAAAGEVHYFDAVALTEGPDTPTYFDGSLAASGTLTYSWDGTAHASTSNVTDSTLGSLPVTTWRNILGPTHEIQIERESLNLGTLTATVLDATLDPSQTTNLRPGRLVRLSALSATASAWEPVFTGKATQIDVEYDEKSVPKKPPRVFLTAVDNTQALAAASRPDGVATMYELAWVLEGAGVPWSVNGSGNQIPSVSIVSKNKDATALDQVAITRDTELGAAWVDRYGVLNVQSPVTAPVVPNPGFETNTTGWTATNGTLARVTTPVRTGTGSLRSTATAAGLMAPRTTGNQIDKVVGGVTYTAEAYSRAATTGRSVLVWIKFSDSTGIVIAESGGTGVTNNTTGWTKSTHTAVAPPGTRYMDVELRVANAAASEIHYFDDLSVVTTVGTVLNESVYTDFDISYSTAQCINSVTVKRILAPDPLIPGEESKAADPVVVEDSTSISTWGRRSAEFTVQGMASGSVAAYAAQILARNANPVVQVNTVSLPIMNASDITTSKALLDLGTVVNVVNTAKAINQNLRINRITHRMTPDKWMVDLGFEQPTSVAAPQVTPPVQDASVTSMSSTAAGSVFMSGPTSSVSISFPAGRFSAAPTVSATCTVGGNVALITNIGSVTTSGCIAYVYGVGGTWTTGAVSIYWQAQSTH